MHDDTTEARVPGGPLAVGGLHPLAWVFILLALVTNKRGVYKAVAYTSAAMYLMMAALFANWIFIS